MIIHGRIFYIEERNYQSIVTGSIFQISFA